MAQSECIADVAVPNLCGAGLIGLPPDRALRRALPSWAGARFVLAGCIPPHVNALMFFETSTPSADTGRKAGGRTRGDG